LHIGTKIIPEIYAWWRSKVCACKGRDSWGLFYHDSIFLRKINQFLGTCRLRHQHSFSSEQRIWEFLFLMVYRYILVQFVYSRKVTRFCTPTYSGY
jgi:hypothetical protein